MSERLRIWNRRPNCVRRSLNNLPMKVSFKPSVSLNIEFLDDFFRCEVTARCIMLMQCMDGDSLGHRARGFGEFAAKDIVTFVGNPDPIHCTQHNGLVRTKDHDSTATEREVVDAFDWIIRHRCAEWRSCIDIECGELQARLSEHRSRSKPKCHDENQCLFHNHLGSSQRDWLPSPLSCFTIVTIVSATAGNMLFRTLDSRRSKGHFRRRRNGCVGQIT